MENYSQFKKVSDKWKLLVAADIVVFGFINSELNVLLIKRKFEPGVGQWALPGGFVREKESLEDAALRELKEETGLDENVYLEQLYSFGEVDRDPRARVIAVAYLLLVGEPEEVKLKATDDAASAGWFPINKLPPLSFGQSHKKIIAYAWQRLKWKLEYTNVGLNLLPESFTLGELQKLYEVVLAREIDKRNFRKKIEAIKFVAPTKKMKKEFGRPAKMYQAREKEVVIYQKII